MRRRKARLIEASVLSPSVRGLVFEATDGAGLDFSPGQYVDLYVVTATGLTFKRSYSIASAPDPSRVPGRFEIAVTQVEEGLTSNALHAMPLDSTVEFEGPYGSFVWRDRADPVLFVATGTGLAPFRSMLEDEFRRHTSSDRAPRTLLFGCRREGDMLWRSAMEAWAREHAGFRYEVTLSRPDPWWGGRSGYVQLHLAELVASMESPRIFVCGVANMVMDVVGKLEGELQIPPPRIHYETYD